MIEGCIIKLKMKKVLLKGMCLDKNLYTCKVDLYERQSEKLTIITGDETLCKLQLDAIYTCDIYTDEGVISCDGYIKERYQCERGNLFTVFIENGFYKK